MDLILKLYGLSLIYLHFSVNVSSMPTTISDMEYFKIGTQSESWPQNVTVEKTSATSVKIIWVVKSPPSTKYIMEYNPIPPKYRVMTDVPEENSCMILEKLLPMTRYQVRLLGVLNKTVIWQSPTISFHTTDIQSQDEKGMARAEEIGIVVLVLGFWMFAIILFFNRWGKIRMLEPYQEPYKEPPRHPHRASCPGLVEPCIVSKYRLSSDYPPSSRPRLGSLAVGRSHSMCSEMPPRRVRSAANLTSLVLLECDEESPNTPGQISMTTAV